MIKKNWLLVLISVFCLFFGYKMHGKSNRTINSKVLGLQIKAERFWDVEEIGGDGAAEQVLLLSKKHPGNKALTLITLKSFASDAGSPEEAYKFLYRQRDEQLSKLVGVTPQLQHAVVLGFPGIIVKPSDGALEEIRIVKYHDKWLEISVAVEGDNRDALYWHSAVRILDSIK